MKLFKKSKKNSLYIKNLLKKAFEEEDGNSLDAALTAIYNSTSRGDFALDLAHLLEFEWHYSHEDIVSELQRLKDNNTTSILLKTAKRKLAYLEYNDSHSLARKCTWALADIHTTESKNALLELSKSKDDVIASYAQKRLDNWNANT